MPYTHEISFDTLQLQPAPQPIPQKDIKMKTCRKVPKAGYDKTIDRKALETYIRISNDIGQFCFICVVILEGEEVT